MLNYFDKHFIAGFYRKFASQTIFLINLEFTRLSIWV